MTPQADVVGFNKTACDVGRKCEIQFGQESGSEEQGELFSEVESASDTTTQFQIGEYPKRFYYENSLSGLGGLCHRLDYHL